MLSCSVAVQILPLDLIEENTLGMVDPVIQYIQSNTEHYHVSSFETPIEEKYKENIKIAGGSHPDIFDNTKVCYKRNEEKVLTTDEKNAKYNK